MGDLRQCHAVNRDFTVDQHHRDPRILGLLHRRNAGLRIGIVQHNALHFAANNQADQFPLAFYIFAMGEHQRAVAQRFSLVFGPFGFGRVIRVIQ
ncbi:hypothetical protein D3C78_1323370 [compost metagenome]